MAVGPLRLYGKRGNRVKITPAELRPPTIEDGQAIWQLAKDTRTLDLNSPYAYLMACRHFHGSSVIAVQEDAVVGFVIGFRPLDQADTVFVWQVGVDPRTQGQGLGARMLDDVARRQAPAPARYLEATVTPSNEASLRLFRSFGRRHSAPITEEVCFKKEHFPGDAHEEEVLLRIGPLSIDQEEQDKRQERKR